MAWNVKRKKNASAESDQYYERTSERAIRRVIADTQGKPFLVVRQAVRDAYPFGERSGKPYRIWLRILGNYEESLVTIYSERGQVG